MQACNIVAAALRHTHVTANEAALRDMLCVRFTFHITVKNHNRIFSSPCLSTTVSLLICLDPQWLNPRAAALHIVLLGTQARSQIYNVYIKVFIKSVFSIR